MRVAHRGALALLALASSLRRFVSDARAAWQDPTLPAPTPQLRDYPIRWGS